MSKNVKELNILHTAVDLFFTWKSREINKRDAARVSADVSL